MTHESDPETDGVDIEFELATANIDEECPEADFNGLTPGTTEYCAKSGSLMACRYCSWYDTRDTAAVYGQTMKALQRHIRISDLKLDPPRSWGRTEHMRKLYAAHPELDPNFLDLD